MLAHVFYMLVARSLKAQLGNPRRMRILNRFFGCSFIALGVGLLRLRAA
jgi:threonine/homoserine/homoserine lactone efflux protein